MKKLKPSSSDKIVLGVCGGLATYFGWDTTLLRVLFALAIVLGHRLASHCLSGALAGDALSVGT